MGERSLQGELALKQTLRGGSGEGHKKLPENLQSSSSGSAVVRLSGMATCTHTKVLLKPATLAKVNDGNFFSSGVGVGSCDAFNLYTSLFICGKVTGRHGQDECSLVSPP